MSDAVNNEPTEPHVNIWRMGSCVKCGAPNSWRIVAVPKLSTGEQFPQFGACEACGHQVDLKDMPPFKVAAEGYRRYEVEPDLRLGIVRVIDTFDPDREVVFAGLEEDAREWIENPASRDPVKPEDYPFR